MQIEIRGLERLSFRERQVVVLKESGRSNQEIAGQLGMSPSTVATLYHRARTKGYNVVVILPGDILGLEGEGTEGEDK
ncbi:MAG TPA: sigma-70 family RNA polymerase sigma factor [Firmicutes bacterium]|nr:sigma-70 family RNA polymerase sigma factor [Bacillota bacterium]